MDTVIQFFICKAIQSKNLNLFQVSALCYVNELKRSADQKSV